MAPSRLLGRNCTMSAIGPSRSDANTILSSSAMAPGSEIFTGTSANVAGRPIDDPWGTRRSADAALRDVSSYQLGGTPRVLGRRLLIVWHADVVSVKTESAIRWKTD